MNKEITITQLASKINKFSMLGDEEKLNMDTGKFRQVETDIASFNKKFKELKKSREFVTKDEQKRLCPTRKNMMIYFDVSTYYMQHSITATDRNKMRKEFFAAMKSEVLIKEYLNKFENKNKNP